MRARDLPVSASLVLGSNACRYAQLFLYVGSGEQTWGVIPCEESVL